MYKRLTPCIFIERGKAVQWFDDRTVIADDVMELARHYNERGADELIIFDLSDSDEEHDETINLLHQCKHFFICIPLLRHNCFFLSQHQILDKNAAKMPSRHISSISKSHKYLSIQVFNPSPA